VDNLWKQLLRRVSDLPGLILLPNRQRLPLMYPKRPNIDGPDEKNELTI
jgi:hypothetical protein